MMFFIKDLNLTRAEMWCFPSSLKQKYVFVDKPIDFMKSFKLNIQRIYKDGRSVRFNLICFCVIFC